MKRVVLFAAVVLSGSAFASLQAVAAENGKSDRAVLVAQANTASPELAKKSRELAQKASALKEAREAFTQLGEDVKTKQAALDAASNEYKVSEKAFKDAQAKKEAAAKLSQLGADVKAKRAALDSAAKAHNAAVDALKAAPAKLSTAREEFLTAQAAVKAAK